MLASLHACVRAVDNFCRRRRRPATLPPCRPAGRCKGVWRKEAGLVLLTATNFEKSLSPPPSKPHHRTLLCAHALTSER